MKYFTKEWWFSDCEDKSVLEEYRNYYSSIFSKLPRQLCSFENEHTLHDAYVISTRSDFRSKDLIINLRGWDKEFNHPVIYEINFIGVSEFDQTFLHEDADNPGLGDLGYWEYELKDGCVEMRILFFSGTQFTITFSDFKFSYVSG